MQTILIAVQICTVRPSLMGLEKKSTRPASTLSLVLEESYHTRTAVHGGFTAHESPQTTLPTFNQESTPPLPRAWLPASLMSCSSASLLCSASHYSISCFRSSLSFALPQALDLSLLSSCLVVPRGENPMI